MRTVSHMTTEPYVIDPAKIAAKIDWHRAEIDRLDAMLRSFQGDDFREFLIPLPSAPKSETPAAATASEKGVGQGVAKRPDASDVAPRATNVDGRGGDDPVYGRLRPFVEIQLATFTSDDLKATAGKKGDRFAVFRAIRRLEKEGRLRTIIPAVGKRKGVYERAEPPESDGSSE